MQTFGYVRVSSIEQESGFGPEVQEAAIRAYCSAKALSEPTIVHESVSAETLSARPEILRLLGKLADLAEAGEEAHLVFRSSDRLARALMDQESVVLTSFKAGFRLHSTLSHEADLFDPTYGADPMRTAIRQFFGIFNQLDKAIIQSRLDGGLHAKAAKGGSTGGRYAFGYMGVNGEIVPDPREAPAVKRLFELDHTGLDLASIAVILAREFPEMCGHWRKATVCRTLRSRNLYQHGLYRSRISPVEVKRPELVLAPPIQGEHVPTARATGEPIDWARVPNPIPAHTLAILLGKSPSWVQAEAQKHALRTKLIRMKLALPHESAQQLETLAKS